MIRLAGINISEQKQIWIALSYIYGIGKSRALKICYKNKLSRLIKLKDLSSKQLDILRKDINKYTIEGDLKRKIYFNIKRLIDLNCYRGIRHKKGLPVRGQRTKTNSRTSRKKLYKK